MPVPHKARPKQHMKVAHPSRPTATAPTTRPVRPLHTSATATLKNRARASPASGLANIPNRGILLTPKQPMDKDTNLRLDFNILKDAAPIEEKPDKEYPEWLWSVTQPQATLYEIGKIPEDELTLVQVRRKFKLERRELIKGNNLASRKQ